MRDTERNLLRRLVAQHTVAHLLLRGDSLRQVAPQVLAAIAEPLEWEVGAIWDVPEESDGLHFVAGWEAAPGGAGELWAASREIDFASGVGLPGRAWESGQMVSSVDLATDPNFLRLPAARAAGLSAGFAIPIPVGAPQDVVGVMEFFTLEFREPDQGLKELLVGFSNQLASFIERRRAEEAVLESAALKSAVLASALDCVISIDHRGHVIEFNPAAERTFGYSRDEVLGRELASFIVPPDFRSAHRTGLVRYLETGEGEIIDRRVELPALRKGGDRFPVELAVTRIAGSDPPLFTAFLRDISDRRSVEQARRHLAAIVQSSDDAVVSTDLEGAISIWNAGAEQTYGYGAAEVLGRTIKFLFPPDRRGEGEWILDQIRRGQSIEAYEAEHMRADGARIDVALTASPLEDPVEGTTGAAIIVRDITPRVRRAKAQEFLAVAGRALDASLDPSETMRTIAATAVPDLAELCVIDLVRDDGLLGDSIVAGVDPEIARELEAIRRRWPLRPDGDHPVARVIRTGRSLVIRDLTTPQVVADVAQSDVHRQFMMSSGYNSAAVAPMIARGRTLGALSLLHVKNDLRYDPSDLELFEDLASRAAMAIDNARLYDERARTAETLQRSLIPGAPPQLSWAEISAAYQAAGRLEVGGDFYDVVETKAGLLLVVGDVAGKGSEAAAVTALIRNSVRALAIERSLPSRILKLVNDVMLHHDLDGRFATAVLAWLDPSKRPARLTVCNCGHPPGMLLSRAGTVRGVGAGTLLGVLDDAEFKDYELFIEPGDTLVLYTDGLLEAGPVDRHISSEDLQQFLASCATAPTDEIVARLRDHALARSTEGVRDDIVVLAVRFAPEAADRGAEDAPVAAESLTEVGGRTIT